MVSWTVKYEHKNVDRTEQEDLPMRFLGNLM